MYKTTIKNNNLNKKYFGIIANNINLNETNNLYNDYVAKMPEPQYLGCKHKIIN
jgi:hypothetical protein